MVEFSLVFILFLGMMAALFEFSRALWVYTTLAHATREGARYAMVHGVNNAATAAQIEARVRANAIGLDSALITVTSAYTPNNQLGGMVSVRATYTFSMILGALIFDSDPNGYVMGAKSQMGVLN
jgi:Flp pilus assembly protein TadG